MGQKKYFVWVDLIRGLSALSVLVWHYPLFYSNFVPVGQLNRSILPFYDYLSPFYLFGEAAVQMFWLISGFVFASNYLSSKDIISGSLLASEKLGQRCALPTSPQPQQQQARVA